jgi:hypothetical protein
MGGVGVRNGHGEGLSTYFGFQMIFNRNGNFGTMEVDSNGRRGHQEWVRGEEEEGRRKRGGGRGGGCRLFFFVASFCLLVFCNVLWFLYLFYTNVFVCSIVYNG